MLAMLVRRTQGGRHKLRVGRAPEPAANLETIDLFAAPPAETDAARPEPRPTEPAREAETDPTSLTRDEPPAPAVGLPAATGRRQPIRLGLSIQFESRPDDAELGRLVDTTIWVNDAHPAYQRAAASRAEGYHVALAVALALGKVAVDPTREREFVLEFLTLWGDARADARLRKGRRRR
jgi:hypothetical protein